MRTTVSIFNAEWEVTGAAVPVVWILGAPALILSLVVGVLLTLANIVLIIPALAVGALLGRRVR